jgi:thiamine biosynthesis lipoprotein
VTPGAGGGALVHTEPVMGTVVSFHVYAGGGPAAAAAARGAVERACVRLHELDDLFSTWKPDSPMSRFRRGELEGEPPAELEEVLALCRTAVEWSGGWFDPWRMPGGVDPTGLVKGWTVERVMEVVREAGAEAAMINAGGDVAVLGEPPGGGAWRIGIRHPWRPDGLACVLETAVAVATSGSYERGPHLVDPRDGLPAEAAASATVTGPSLAMADALATALAVGGEEVLAAIAELDGYEGYLIGLDGTEQSTPGIVFA